MIATSPSAPGAIEAGNLDEDQLNGGVGDDTLNDCSGHNRLDGGDGANACQFDASASSQANCTFVSSCS